MRQTATRDGVGLAYVEKGPITANGRGRRTAPLLFLPGSACDWWSFHEQLDYFSAGHLCVALDPRGHGGSDKPEQDYTIAAHAADVAWIIVQLGLESPVIIGHSTGAAVALQLAADFPHATRAIVLIEPTLATDHQAVFERMLSAFDRDGVDATRRRAFRSQFLDGHDEVLLARICERASRTPDQVYRSEIEQLLRWDGLAAASQCRVPALHIAAARPACSPSKLTRVLPRVVTGQTVGGGHFNMLEVPDQVNAMIEQFIRHHAI